VLNVATLRVAGVDGTKSGWVAIVLEDGGFASAHLIRRVDSDFGEVGEVAVLAIDVPIGFGPREADRAARRFLSGAARTVFTTPPRELLEQPFRPGLGISAQAHALGARILHVTALAAADARIHEVHPEVSFRAMNGGEPLRHRKKSAGGALQRIELLARQGIELGPLGEVGDVPLDDVLDAAAAAWTAQRIATRAAVCLPDPPELAGGRSVAIWY
jgi:predicted RNase H-like nuclease